MPKLPAKTRKAAEKAELSTGFKLAAVGTYIAVLKEVDTDATSAAGNPKWVFKWGLDTGPFEAGEPEEGAAEGEVWEHCALSEAAAWKLKQIYAAMGFTLDSDTDEMIGEKVGLVIDHQEIAEGKNKGKMGATITSYFDPDNLEDELANAG